MRQFSLNKNSLALSLGCLIAGAVVAPEAKALTLDWSGYFRADYNYVGNYVAETGGTPAVTSDRNTSFSTVFMKLRPKVLVNDNVIVRSEWDIGDQVYGLFGRGIPRDQRSDVFGTDRAPFPIGARRLWLDVHTDFGTVQVGRAPFAWGLGAIFNAGDNPSDRYQTTMDTVRLVSKFGYLSVMPFYAKAALGRSIGGARSPVGPGTPPTAFDTVASGSDDITDYGIALRFENPEEELEAGALYYKRAGSDSQNSYLYGGNPPRTYTAGANGMSTKLINVYGKKTFKRLEIGAELPIFSGTVADITGAGVRNNYSSIGLAGEAALKYDTWRHSVKFGFAPGQEAAAGTGAANRGNSFKAMSFNRAYKLGLIMFNYNLNNFGVGNPDAVPGNPNSDNAVVSPYDAAITNARYVMLSSEKRWEQWGLNVGVVWAQANQAAQSGRDFYNTNNRNWYAATTTQGKNMGVEFDVGARYNWDDNISFGLDGGLLVPGDYLKTTGNNAGAQVTGLDKTVAAVTLSASTVF
ncbi:MAG: hypothetical protein EOP11_04345 [Proteobacteria bacterium]|nr:MAG: hypothetical protein EOP11_04345 [Pseudomonadota bacterium]